MIAQLLLISLTMAVMSLLAGTIPLLMQSRARTANWMAKMRPLVAGLMLSTSFTLVLPEVTEHVSGKWYMGPTIMLGFWGLYVLDVATAEQSPCEGHRVRTGNVEDGDDDGTLVADNDDQMIIEDIQLMDRDHYGSLYQIAQSIWTNSTSVGLILHCLSDGILLAVSLMSDDDDDDGEYGFFMVLAIFAHKLPAAFSLTSLLINDGLPTALVMIHLIVFSVSAPIGAVCTSLVLALFTSSNTLTTGLLLSFSLGAFIYVAFHTMQSSRIDKSSLKYLLVGSLLPLLVLPFGADD